MITTDKTAKELFHEVIANPQRVPFGFGEKAVLINVDPQKAYTRTDLFKTAYETDPKQLNYVNDLAKSFRQLDWPVVWTHVAFLDSARAATRRTRFRTSSTDPSVPNSTSGWRSTAAATSSTPSACPPPSSRRPCSPFWSGIGWIR